MTDCKHLIYLMVVDFATNLSNWSRRILRVNNAKQIMTEEPALLTCEQTY